MDDEPVEERQEGELDGENTEPEKADHHINFGVGRGEDVGKVWGDGIDPSGSIGLHEDTVKGRIKKATSGYRGCHGDGEEGIVYIETLEPAVANDGSTDSNGGC